MEVKNEVAKQSQGSSHSSFHVLDDREPLTRIPQTKPDQTQTQLNLPKMIISAYHVLLVFG